MAQKELLASLWRKGEERIAGLKRDAEEEAAAFAKEMEERLREKKRHFHDELLAAKDGLVRETELAAERKKRETRTRAKAELADRFAVLARRLLPVLREDGYEALFAGLAGEIPAEGVEGVAVNPADEELARRYFPQATIVPERSILGGLRTSGAGGGMSIDNTLEKRLQRSWQELLPLLIKEVEDA